MLMLRLTLLGEYKSVRSMRVTELRKKSQYYALREEIMKKITKRRIIQLAQKNVYYHV